MTKRDCRGRIILICFIIALTALPGCLSWEEGWKAAEKASLKGDVAALLAKANRQANDADNRDKVLELIKTYESVLKIDPQNYEALNSLGTYYLLMGYGYSANADEKKADFIKVIQYCERGMYTNPAFKAAVDNGEKVWKAAAKLTKREMGSMFHWYLALGSIWNDCMSAPARILNITWTPRIMEMLKAMTAIDAGWGEGSIHMCWAVYYSVLPGLFGGDLNKAGEYFDKAFKAGPKMLSFREIRAKVYQTKKKDKGAFTRDCEAAIKQNPHDSGILEYPWSIYHQRSARELLAHINEYF